PILQIPGLKESADQLQEAVIVDLFTEYSQQHFMRNVVETPFDVSFNKPLHSRPTALHSWLSHAPRPVVTPATTMAAPSPWPLRAVGDPVVRRHHTSEVDVGAPLIPLLDLTGQCPSLRRCIVLTVHGDAQVGDGCQALLPAGGHSHHWGLGFKQFSLHHVDRVERNLPDSVFVQLRPSPSM